MFSSFAGTNLHEVLRGKNITQLVMVGVATDFVVDATSWSASDLGYDVIVVSDGCCSNNVAAHEDALKRMAARADIADSATLLGALR
jgi:nicotinamidase-related amidase